MRVRPANDRERRRRYMPPPDVPPGCIVFNSSFGPLSRARE
jgi:hypothetical protein